ncbi:MAG: hypothetical protein P8X42_10080 [Calditrichaceae bacterium]
MQCAVRQRASLVEDAATYVHAHPDRGIRLSGFSTGQDEESNYCDY